MISCSPDKEFESSDHSNLLLMTTPAVEYDKGNLTRLLCLAGLTISALVGIVFIVIGIILPEFRNQNFGTESTRVLVPLVINVGITLLTETLGLIHASTLKWALLREGRLTFNANLRLFTSSQQSWSNSRMVNALYLFTLTMGYAASSSFLIPYADESVLNTRSSDRVVHMAFSKAASFCLGAALLLACAICLWSVLTTDIPTWNTNPLTILAACRNADVVTRSPQRCMRSVHEDLFTSKPTKPAPMQGSAYMAHPEVKTVLWALSVTMLAGVVWAGVILGLYRRLEFGSSTPTWSLVPTIDQELASGSDELTTPFVRLGFFLQSGEVVVVVQILFAMIFQAFITVGTHCAELQIALDRDESIWRAATSLKGAKAERGGLSVVLTSSPNLFLLIFKPVIHWVYGLAMLTSYRGLYMLAPQIVYLTLLWSIFLAFVSYVSFRKPEGPQPATYGHLQTLANLIDEWSPTIYWGHKSRGEEGVCHAGTSPHPLPNVDMNSEYMGTFRSSQR